MTEILLLIATVLLLVYIIPEEFISLQLLLIKQEKDIVLMKISIMLSILFIVLLVLINFDYYN